VTISSHSLADGRGSLSGGRRPFSGGRRPFSGGRSLTGGHSTALVQPKLEPIVPVSLATHSMGGRLAVHVDAGDRQDEAAAAARMVAARIDCWAARLTRHADDSDLSRLNSDPRQTVPVRPTLAAALEAGREATGIGGGYVDITLLDERLAAEHGIATSPGRQRNWQITRARRGSAAVTRQAGIHFDLGGVGKGWIADRALRLLTDWRGALVDADGDMAIRSARGSVWEIGIDDPRALDGQLAVLRIGSGAGFYGGSTTWGVATSGTSIHRWNVGGRTGHHLIDPRTGLPARTDVVQATVIAGSALRAEAFAKAAVIAGSVAGFALLDRARVHGAVLLLETGEVLALPATLSLLAA
jgi:FAD:protein FMN transferase